MIAKGTEAWTFFISLVDDHVPMDEALRMTRRRFAKTIIEQMNDDLTDRGIERD